MTTTNNNRKILDLKRWEVCGPASVGRHLSSAVNIRHIKQWVFAIGNSLPINYLFCYDVAEDAWLPVGSMGVANGMERANSITYAAWSTGSTLGVSFLTATAGTTSTITTNQTIVRDLRGWKIHIMSGPNAGATLTISSNTTGANSVITVPTQASAFSASTTYRLLTPRVYMFGGNSVASGNFRVYDFATNTFQSISVTSGPGSVISYYQSAWVSTPSWRDSDYLSFATGTATSATLTTIVNTAKTWTTNQWSNYQIRIVSGTGAGQIRSISSNTADTITVSAAWTTTPDNTSSYSIEGNDDYLYFFQTNSQNLYRYSISGNSWTLVSSTRPTAMYSNCSAVWVNASTDSSWTSENDIQNGKYIFSFTGSGATPVILYNIAANTWTTTALTPGEDFGSTTGGCSTYGGGDYIYMVPTATSNRVLRYNVVTKDMEPFTGLPFSGATTGTAGGNYAWVGRYVDGATAIDYFYTAPSQTYQLQRMMVI